MSQAGTSLHDRLMQRLREREAGGAAPAPAAAVQSPAAHAAAPAPPADDLRAQLMARLAERANGEPPAAPGMLDGVRGGMRGLGMALGAAGGALPPGARGSLVDEARAGVLRGVVRLPGQIAGAAGAGAAGIEALTGPTQATGFVRDAAGLVGAATDATGNLIAPGTPAAPLSPVGLAGSMGESVPQLAAATGAGLLTGGAGGIALFMGTAAAPVVGQTYNEAVAAHGDPQRAAAEAGINGAVTLATSWFPGVALLRKLPGGDALLRRATAGVVRRVGWAAAAEGGQEFAEQIGQEITADLIRNGREADAGWVMELLTDPARWEQRAASAIAGAGLGGVARGAVEGGAAVGRAVRADQSQNNPTKSTLPDTVPAQTPGGAEAVQPVPTLEPGVVVDGLAVSYRSPDGSTSMTTTAKDARGLGVAVETANRMARQRDVVEEPPAARRVENTAGQPNQGRAEPSAPAASSPAVEPAPPPADAAIPAPPTQLQGAGAEDQEGRRWVSQKIQSGDVVPYSVHADGRFFAGVINHEFPIDPTPQERKAAKAAMHASQLADTPEERMEAKRAMDAALRPAAMRALGDDPAQAKPPDGPGPVPPPPPQPQGAPPDATAPQLQPPAPEAAQAPQVDPASAFDRFEAEAAERARARAEAAQLPQAAPEPSGQLIPRNQAESGALAPLTQEPRASADAAATPPRAAPVAPPPPAPGAPDVPQPPPSRPDAEPSQGADPGGRPVGPQRAEGPGGAQAPQPVAEAGAAAAVAALPDPESMTYRQLAAEAKAAGRWKAGMKRAAVVAAVREIRAAAPPYTPPVQPQEGAGRTTPPETQAPQRPRQWADDEATAGEIAAAVGAGQHSHYGLRVVTSLSDHFVGEKPAPIFREGDSLPHSFRWDDGNLTDEQLAGTSVLELRDSSPAAVRSLMSRLKPYGGNQIVLVGGERVSNGQDRGEALLTNAKVLATWFRDPSKASFDQPAPAPTGGDAAPASGDPTDNPPEPPPAQNPLAPPPDGGTIQTEPPDERSVRDDADDRAGEPGRAGEGQPQDAPGAPGAGLAPGRPAAEPRQPGGRRGRRPGSVDADAGGGEVGPDAQAAPEQAGGDAGAQGADGATARGRDGDPPLDPADRNHAIAETDTLAPRGDAAKFRANLEAVRLLKALESEKRNPTPDEKRALAQYTGWGWAGEYFNDANPRYASQRDQLREAMSDKEFRSASRSTLNAHYTAPEVIRAMWAMAERLGFKGGRVLEPSAGVGHYLGLMPPAVAARSEAVAVELDDLSGRILGKLYPQAQVHVRGFESARVPNNSVDLAISNVPFGDYKVPGAKDYPTLNIHDYFFARSLDKVRPGGLVMFVTSHFTMDKSDASVRRMLAEKADLVAAVRLPSDAFMENAGTAVTTDIIVLRKKSDEPFPHGEAWTALREVGTWPVEQADGTKIDQPIRVNEYFAQRPAMVMGKHTLAGTMHARKEFGKEEKGEYSLKSVRGEDLAGKLAAAAAGLPKNVIGEASSRPTEPLPEMAAEDQKQGAYLINAEGHFVQVVGSELRPAPWLTRKAFGDNYDDPVTPSDAAKRREIAADWLRLRKIASRLFRAENDPHTNDASLVQMRRELNRVYDDYVKKHGTLRKRFAHNEKAVFLSEDPEYPLLQAMEREVVDIDPKTGRERYSFPKGDIFTKRIREPRQMPTSAKDLGDAVAVSLGWHNAIRPDLVARLLGMTEDDARGQIVAAGRAFQDPDSGLLQSRERYLSGNVRKKLRAAEAAAAEDPERYGPNVEALKAVQPKDVPLGDISFSPASRWIPAEITSAFAGDLFKTTAHVTYTREVNSFTLRLADERTPEVLTTWATPAVDGGDLLTHAMNGTTPTVRIKVDKDKTVVDQKATIAARAMMDKIKREFVSWAKTTGATVDWKDGTTYAVPELMEKVYNELNNSVVPAVYDGSYLALPGVSNTVRRLPHRLSVVARVLQEGYGVMAHGVGSGKTFSQIVLAMELRRLGLAKKPMIVVQKATIGQFAASFREAYPDARILVANEKTFAAKNRRRLMSQIALGEFDAVIVTQPQFDLLRVSPAAEMAYYQEKLDALEEAIRYAKAAAGKGGGRGKDPTTKELEKAKARLEAKMLHASDRMKARQDDTVAFDELGIDALLVDEAHAYKRLPIITKKVRVKGIPGGESQRAMGLEMKAGLIHKARGGKYVIPATGTPVTNTMAEAYVMLKLGAPNVLAEYDIQNFDEFADTFGETVTKLEFTWAGRWKLETRFNRFVNGPELVSMIRSGFDVKMGNKELGLKVPEIRGGKPELMLVPQTPAMEEATAFLNDVADAFERATDKREIGYVPIFTMQAGMAAALDPRLIDPSLPDDPGSKVNTAVARIHDIWKSTTKDRGTQLVFADRFRPMNVGLLRDLVSGKGRRGSEETDEDALLENQEREEAGVDADKAAENEDEARAAKEDADFKAGGLNIYKEMREKLVAMGIPRDQIAIIHEHNSDQQREKLFAQMNAGRVRVLLGSTEKMGVGVNVQKKLVALHHLDPPRMMNPAMKEQRDGRGIRQGNDNEVIDVIHYGVERSMDTGIYQKLEDKQRFIVQVLSGRGVGRTFDDAADEVSLSMSEIKAALTGDPRVMQRVELEQRVNEMRAERSAFESTKSTEIRNRQEYRRRAEWAENTRVPELGAALEAAAAAVGDGKTWAVEVGSRTYTERAEAAKAIEAVYTGAADQAQRMYRKSKDGNQAPVRESVKVNGLVVAISASHGLGGPRTSTEVFAGKRRLYQTEGIGTGAGLLSSFSRLPESLEVEMSRARATAADARKQIAALDKAVAVKWDREDQLAEAERKLQALEMDLMIDSDPQMQRKRRAVVEKIDHNPDLARSLAEQQNVPVDGEGLGRRIVAAMGLHEAEQAVADWPAPPPPAIADAIESAADAAIEAARKRQAERRIPRGRGTGGGVLAEEIVDAGIIAAARVAKAGAKGYKGLKKAVNEAIGVYGDRLAGQYRAVRKAAVRILRASRAEDGTYDPELFEGAVAGATRREPLRRSVKATIAESVGGAKPEPTVTEPSALKAGLRKAERAGRAAYREGRAVERAAAHNRLDVIREELQRQVRTERLKAGMRARAKGDQALEREKRRTTLREEYRQEALGLIRRHAPKESKAVLLSAAAEATTPARLISVAVRLRKAMILAEARRAARAAKKVGKQSLASLEPEMREEADAAMGAVARARVVLRQAKLGKGDIATLEAARDELVSALRVITGLLHEQRSMDQVRIKGQVLEAIAIRSEVVARLQEKPELPTPERGAPEPGALVRVLRERTNWESLSRTLDAWRSGGPAMRLFREALRGRRESLRLAQEFQDRLGEIARANGYASLGQFQAELSGTLGRASQKMLDLSIGGRPRLTMGEAAYLYASWGDAGFKARVKSGQRLQFRDNPTDAPFRLTEADFARVEAALPANVRRIVDQAKALYDAHYFERMSAVNKRLKGYHLDKVPGYFGIKLNRRYSEGKGTPFSWRRAVIRAWEESGFMQERIGPSKTPILVGDFGTDITLRSRSAATVVGKAEITKLLTRVLLHPDIQTAVTRRFGRRMVERLELRISLFSGGDIYNEADMMGLRTIQSFWARGKTQLWIPTWLRNAFAGSARMANDLGGLDLGRAVLRKPTWTEFRELVAYSPELRERWEGHRLSSFYDPGAMQGAEAKFKEAVGATFRQLGEIVANLARARLGEAGASAKETVKPWRSTLDAITVGNAFDATGAILAYRHFKAKAPKHWSEQARKRWAARQATRVFERNSNTATIEYANDIQLKARQSYVIQAFIPFTGDTAKMQNMLYEALHSGTTAKVRVSAVLVASAGLSATVTLLQGLLLGDDEEKAVGAGTARLAQEFASIVPGVGLPLSQAVGLWFRGGTRSRSAPELEMPVLEIVNGALGAMHDLRMAWERMGDPRRRRVVTSSEHMMRAMAKIGETAGTSAGLPVHYVWAVRKALKNWAAE